MLDESRVGQLHLSSSSNEWKQHSTCINPSAWKQAHSPTHIHTHTQILWWVTTALHTMESFISTGAVLLLYLPHYNPWDKPTTLSFPALGPLSNQSTLNNQTEQFSLTAETFFACEWLWLNVIVYILYASLLVRVCIYVRKYVRGRESSLALLFSLRACLCYMLGVLKEQGAHSTAPKTTAIRSNSR